MWYLITAIIVFIIAFGILCALIKHQLKFPFMPYDFDDFVGWIGVLLMFSALWIIVIPVAFLVGITYCLYIYLTNCD